MKRLRLIFLFAILVFGAYLRLYKISQYMTFLGDEGRDMLVVLHMIVNHKFTLLGPTASVGGFFLGPIYYYFMLPFVWLWGLNPVGAAIMVACFGIATIYLVYRVGTDLFDGWVGLIASALYAASPLVIAYSRSSWNPNVVPFFAILLIYLLWKSVVQKRPRLIFWVGVVLGIGLQLHYLFLFLFGVVGVWYLLYGRKTEWLRDYALGIVGFLIGYGPFLAFEVRHGFPNTISIIRFLLSGKDTGFRISEFVLTVSSVAYRMFGRLVLRLPPPEQLVNYSPAWQQFWLVFPVAALFASLAALYWAFRLHKEQQKSVLLFGVWFIVPVLLFGLYKKAIYDYYFGILFPLPFLMSAVLLRMIGKKRIGAGIAAILFAALWYWNWMGRPFLFAPNNQLGQTQRIAQVALSKTDGKPFNFALLTGGNSDYAYRFFFERWGRAPVTIENVAIDPERKTVTNQLIVICEYPDCKPLGASLWEIAGFGRAEILGSWNVPFVTIYKLGHYKGSS